MSITKSQTEDKQRTAHTPGPWEYARTEHVADDGSLVAGHWVRVDECMSLASLMPVDEVGANARLMAAAPEMRALIEAWLGPRIHEDTAAIYREARALLARIDGAKAEGR